eukprot:TRINITY_DN10215_c0_g1_i1.p1 TRINITY_DN10215_c0_g1~~TRINITY_DN10215_c0_g1_i1.p1  ORF type:complete len:293 (+),score=94.69 TRINITY_DN10215_c0_g1_i1:87-965(+)
MSKKVLIGGGTGFVGQVVTNHLKKFGFDVSYISRKAQNNAITWADIERYGINGYEAVIQIPGANIVMMPWTSGRKQELWDSRVETTKLLVNAIRKSDKPPSVFISGSAIGIYPTSEERQYDETCSDVASDFAGKLVKAWEDSSLPLDGVTRRVVTRFGVVLGKEGGMYPMMSIPFKLGFGGRIGSGNQYFPWVHVEDIARLHKYIIDHPDMSGVYNATSPDIITNLEFTKALGSSLHRPTIMPLPSIAVKTLFGERAFLLLEGQQVIPKRTLDSGFEFKYPTIQQALQNITQ